ncbi:MAG: DUF2059 domain-containing protein [Candidatus Electrothrix sp. GM3_4]|nr:DUF2059 domain-containing protein [Candidatus Electrothrix sp. GM3_4]
MDNNSHKVGLAFYETDLGQKVLRVSSEIGQTLQAEIAKKQRDAVNKEAALFNKETERLYLKYLEEDGKLA